MSFSHLHVASAYSLRHGVSSPQDLVTRAVELDLPSLALTDRDGLYGAVRFMQACLTHGLPGILGVDLALADPHEGSGDPPSRRTPARGGAWKDTREPRIVLLARGGRGWAALSRLVSGAHIAGERGNPRVSWDLLEEFVVPGDLQVLLGPDSPVGRAISRHRFDLADKLLDRWRYVAGDNLYVEVVSHRTPPRTPGDQRAAPDLSTPTARRTWTYALERDIPAVLTNAVRYCHPRQAATADLLDAIRRLVPLDSRHLDRENSAGYLAPAVHMRGIAEQIAGERAGRLLGQTEQLAHDCVLDPVHDFGIGDIHVPELDVLLSGAPAEPTGPVMAGYAARRHRHVQRKEEAVRADALLRTRCEASLHTRFRTDEVAAARQRLDSELGIIAGLGFAGYFLTVAEVVDLIRAMQVRVAARGSGAGSVVNYLLGISGVDPLRHDLLMERFLSPLRRVLPDIDIDVESARRTDIYRKIVDRFGAHRSACVSMRDTYKVRHAIRDVGAALGLPAGEIDDFAKAFPHIRARDARAALAELPELQTSTVGKLAERGMLDGFLHFVESLDGLPRHIAMHPCGVLLSDSSLLDRTPVEASWMGFPMSQFDKDDVEAVGFLKLDVLGIRMQSAMAHAVTEVRRVEGVEVDLENLPFDDADTFDMIQKAKTLGCFQIESPGQRELIGKFGPKDFNDLIIDISLFRPGPVKSDMITPFLSARHGWREPLQIHPDLEPALHETHGVVVFHEQVLRIVSVMTGCSLAEADEVRRSLGTPDGQIQIRDWFIPAALARKYPLTIVEKVWEVLRSFGSFGFCKAHAAAFALPTYHSAWLKRHYPAAFLSGVLTHDPGMYPKRLILDEARNSGVQILPLDVNVSAGTYRVEAVGSGAGIRLSLADVKGISEVEIAGIEAAQPFVDLTDFWVRTTVTRPVVERLIRTGAFDAMHGITSTRRAGHVTRRDLLLQVADLHRTGGRRRVARTRTSSTGDRLADRVAAQSQAPKAAIAPAAQLVLPLGDLDRPSGLPEMSLSDRVEAEVEILGLDVSQHAIRFYESMLADLGVVRAKDLLNHRSQEHVLVAGIKVATQTPPIRSGRRVIFLTLDDSTGPVDLTFFEDAQGPYAHTVFHSWLLLGRGEIRRTGRRGISVRATGCWALPEVHEVWRRDGAAGVRAMLEIAHDPTASDPRMEDPTQPTGDAPAAVRRVLVHASGFRQSPYADTKPAGESVKKPKLWHSSPGSAG